MTTVIDLDQLDGADGFRLDGVDASDYSGFSVSGAGDVNGDGFADIVVGADRADGPDGANAGESYVVFGRASGFDATLDLATLDGQNGFRLDGVDAGDFSGRSVSGAGDVNGDGFADLIIGAYDATAGGESQAGESYVVFGQASGFGAAFDLATLDGANGFRLAGVDAGDRSGSAVSGAGDVNGDGFADLIIGAYGADGPAGDNVGETYVVFGGASGFGATLDLATLDGANGFRLDGVDDGDRSGRAVSGAGDVNGDGFADLIVGAYAADRAGAGNSGESYVVFGKAADFDAALDLSTLDGANGFRLDGIDDGDFSGLSVGGAGDVNGDGFHDLIVGAHRADPGGDSKAGESYVVFGQASGFGAALDLAALDGVNGFRLDGVDGSDYSGLSVGGAGDVNGDGFDDLIVGAALADPNGDSAAGESYVVFGRSSGFGAALDLSILDESEGFRIDGVDAFDRSGRAVSGAGDVNGDGFADLIIGAYVAGANNAGRSYVVFGFDAGSVTHRGGAGDDELLGDGEANVMFGGQGADVLIGAGGQDVLRGGVGDDVLSIADGDFARVDGGLGDDTLRLASAGLALDLTLTNPLAFGEIEAIDLAGAGSNVVLDRLTVLNLSETSNAVRVTGDAASILTLIGAGWSVGADDAATRTFENGAAAIVVDRTTRLIVDGDANANILHGVDGADLLRGAAGDDDLFGEGGDDLLFGGTGDDDLNGGDGVDSVDYSDAGGAVTANLTSGAAADGDGGGDTLIAIETLLGSAFDDVLVGDAAANTLIGAAGVDRLNGRGGDDTLVGGAGNDVYTVSDAGDVVTELVDEGADRVNTFVDYVNPDHVEFLVGKYADVGLNLTGNDVRNQITGANKIDSPDAILGLGGHDLLVGLVGDDHIDGGAGNDRIFGNSGFDTLVGGTGNDRLTGQQHADTFVHRPGDGYDRIADFDVAEDLLDLTAHGFADFAAVQAILSDQPGGAQLDLVGSDRIELQGVAAASVGQEDVLI